MKRASLVSRVAFVAVIFAGLVQRSAADPPDILRDYRFITSRSTVDVSGGSSDPYELRLAIRGRFGVTTGYDYGVDPTSHVPILVPHAEFVDVNAILFNPLSMAPMPVPGWDLDETLNLTGLNGTFRGGDPKRLFFEGVDGQGAPIKLEAAIHDPLIHIVGQNNPHCAGCSPDFRGYKIDALGFLSRWADFNSDGLVDAADYIKWRTTPMSSAMTDNGNQIEIDSSDFFEVWRAEFGQIATSAGGASFSDSTVPEPMTLALLLSGALALAAQRIRRIG